MLYQNSFNNLNKKWFFSEEYQSILSGMTFSPIRVTTNMAGLSLGQLHQLKRRT